MAAVFLSVLTVFIVDAIQKQQILMQKTQQFVKGVKGVRVTRLKQQIFFTYEHSAAF